MYVVTGAAGFIGSALIWELNRRGYDQILAVDHFEMGEKWQNLRNLEIFDYMDKQIFLEKIRCKELAGRPEVIFHLGACSATTETDMGYLMENNYNYTLQLARYALENNSRFIYASSAATYGDGSHGYADDHKTLQKLQPLNKYAYSKYLFDLHAYKQGWLDQLVGLKYFNVYGPNEYHKGNMRSVVHKSFQQALTDGEIRLFKSHRSDFEDGGQKRDFLYVKDAVKMTLFFLDNPGLNGIYNIGRGKARTFADLGATVLETVKNSEVAETTGKEEINYIDMPAELRDRYQYYTEADISKLREAGYRDELYHLEEGIQDYLENYLLTEDPYLNPH